MSSPQTFHARLASLRYRNVQGNIIPLHHAFLTVEMNSFSRISAVVIPIFFMATFWLLLPLMLAGWSTIFEFWTQHIYHGTINHAEVRILGQNLLMPYPELQAETPAFRQVLGSLVICILLFMLSFVAPSRFAPPNYLMRTVLLIQASASIDRLVSPEFFPYTLETYLVDSLSLSIYLVFLLPAVLGCVYYIFDFGLWRKALLTALMLLYYFLTIPCQYMLHAVVIHEWTLLMLPLMYLLFGTLLDVLMFVSIYAFGMSWRSKEKALQGRGL